MNPLRSIIAATDLSAPSRHAADRAMRLAHSAGASVHLVHAVATSALDDLKRWLGDDTRTLSALHDEARGRLHAQAAELARRHGVQVNEHLVAGHPVEAVTRQAEQLQADLLVTGTRGAGFLRGVVVGSTAERIAKRSRRPVLMVRQTAHEQYRRVLVPVDFSPWSAGAIDLAASAAPQGTLVLMHAVVLPYEGKLRLAGVADSVVARYREQAQREALQHLQQLVERSGLPAQRLHTTVVDGADPWMLIAQQEQEHDCDLIVIGKHGRQVLEDLLLGSTTRMVLSECSADVLVSTLQTA
ncbi:MAG TPA: universal stress protein [Burkholderiaceae bacterium]|nr:universal stress protein [Burkholderiaceae bacterium]